MNTAPLPADPLAPYAIEELRSGDELDCVIVTGPAIGRVKMPRTAPQRGRALAEGLRDRLNAIFAKVYNQFLATNPPSAAFEFAAIEASATLLGVVGDALRERPSRVNPEPRPLTPSPEAN